MTLEDIAELEECLDRGNVREFLERKKDDAKEYITSIYWLKDDIRDMLAEYHEEDTFSQLDIDDASCWVAKTLHERSVEEGNGILRILLDMWLKERAGEDEPTEQESQDGKLIGKI